MLPADLPRPPTRRDTSLGIVLIDLSSSLRGDGFAQVLAGVIALLEGTPLGGRWGVCGFRDRPVWIAEPGSRVDAALLERVRAAASARPSGAQSVRVNTSTQCQETWRGAGHRASIMFE